MTLSLGALLWACSLVWQVPGTDVLAVHGRLNWTEAWLAVKRGNFISALRQLQHLCAVRGERAGQSRALTRRRPLAQQALPQKELVVVHRSLHWILLLKPFSPSGAAGAPAPEQRIPPASGVETGRSETSPLALALALASERGLRR